MFHYLIRPIQRNAVRQLLTNNSGITIQHRKELYRNFASGKAPPVKDRFYDIPQASKDVLLYFYDRFRFYRIVTILGALQFIGWTYLAAFVQGHAKDIDPDLEVKKSTPKARPFIYRLREALNIEDKYKHGLSVLFLTIGSGFFLLPGMMALRTVHMVVLRKGGKTVDIVTFALFGGRRTIANLPLEYVSCYHSLQTSNTSLSLKVKGRSFYFLVDMKGRFPNPKLFEQTVGLHRTFKK